MKRYSTLIVLFMGVLTLSTGAVLLAPEPGLTPLEQLGKELFFDKISSPDRMACAACHAPDYGFTGGVVGINKNGSVYRGAVSKRFGNRKPPSAAYATLSPVFHFDEDEGHFEGGNFWDGRATGDHLGNPAADQALGPFLNPVEQNNPSKQAVLEQVAASRYAGLWEEVWGEPLDPYGDVEGDYDRIGLAIAAYEGSAEVNAFTSKYDYYLRGEAELTEQEEWGLELFDGKAMCAACHPSEPDDEGGPPLFTDFTFDNLGVPKNPDNPFYDMDEVLLDNGSPINPMGDAWVDPGLGGFLEHHPNPAWAAMAGENMGKHKVPTLRNVAKGSSSDSKKAFTHNGVFKSLSDVVHFYNTRDVENWPAPEVPQNVNTDELGDLGLTPGEEAAIVAFMQTLSDGYKVNDGGGGHGTGETGVTSSAHPNPFNPSTTITYSMPEAGNVRIVVYDALGREVQVLVDGAMSEGTYSVRFDAGGLPSGVYFYRVETGNAVSSRQLVLVK